MKKEILKWIITFLITAAIIGGGFEIVTHPAAFAYVVVGLLFGLCFFLIANFVYGVLFH